MEHIQKELQVIVKSKDLCSYVLTVTQKSPKHFRYTFVSRMQNLALEVIEKLYRANDVFLSKNDAAAVGRRLELQREALTDLRILSYISMLAMEQNCILPKQYEQIAKQSAECMNMLGAWMNSDRKRVGS